MYEPGVAVVYRALYVIPIVLCYVYRFPNSSSKVLVYTGHGSDLENHSGMYKPHEMAVHIVL